MSIKLKCGNCDNMLEEVVETYYLTHKGYIYPVEGIKQWKCKTCDYNAYEKEHERIMKKTIDSYKGRFKDA